MKIEWIELYNGDILIAKQVSDNSMELVDNSVELPFGLFSVEDKGEIIDIFHFYKWLLMRVFPEDRIGVQDLLKAMDLQTYDKASIVRKVNGRMFQDNFNVKWVTPNV